MGPIMMHPPLDPGPLDLLYQPVVERQGHGWALRLVEGLRRDPTVLESMSIMGQLDADLASVPVAAESVRSWGDCLLSLNISWQYLQVRRYAIGVVKGLADSQLLPERLILELIESEAPLIGYPGVQPNMQLLRGCGVKFLLDDVGTGYFRDPQHVQMTLQSQPHVNGYPCIIGVKLARQLIAKLDRPRAFSLAATYITVAINNGASLIIAEGIEPDQPHLLDRVLELEDLCRAHILVQGFVISPKIEACQLQDRFV